MIKVLLEMGPVIVFFATYKYSNIFAATLLMVVVTIICLLISYLIYRKISLPLLISAGLLLVSGIVTLLSGDTKYIKMKPTIVYLIFAIGLYVGSLKKKLMLKDVFGIAIKMLDKHWLNMSHRFAVFFLFLAILNEIVWRFFSEDTWVNFKVIGVLPMTMLFVATQIPFLIRHQIKDNDSK